MTKGSEEELLKAVKELKSEVKELRGIVNILLNMMVEVEDDHDDFSPQLMERGNESFLMYN